jgi:hypothetical protein
VEELLLPPQPVRPMLVISAVHNRVPLSEFFIIDCPFAERLS